MRRMNLRNLGVISKISVFNSSGSSRSNSILPEALNHLLKQNKAHDEHRDYRYVRARLSLPGGRHLYGVLGTYDPPSRFAVQLPKAKSVDGNTFPKDISVNRASLKLSRTSRNSENWVND